MTPEPEELVAERDRLAAALREIAEPMPTEDGDWGATFDWHDLAMKRRDIARAALSAADRPEGTTPPDAGFAGTPPHLQPNGGSCTCTVVMLDGQRMNPDRSRCPIHGRTT